MKLYLIDALAIIYRAHFAFIKNPRKTTSGKNTSPTFGFTNSLFEIIQKEKPTHLGVAFDPPGPTIRQGYFADYKTNRQETPEDIIQAIPDVKKILNAWNIPILEQNGYEADDIIGTLASKALQQKIITYMVTPDKDYAQLVSDFTFLYKPSSGDKPVEIMNPQKVFEKFGVYPNQIPDLLGLMGDSSDNYPGVPGIGEKTATQLIAQFASIENLYLNIDQVSKPAIKQKLIQHKDLAFLSMKLATILTDLPIELDLHHLQLEPPDLPKLLEVFNDLEFKNLSQRVQSYYNQPSHFNPQPTSQPRSLKTIHNTTHDYKILENLTEIQSFSNLLIKQKAVAFDTETDGLDPLNAKLVGMSFAFEPHAAFYIPINHKNVFNVSVLLQKFFNNSEILKIGQNLKFDIQVLESNNILVQGPFFDTMIAHYLLNPEAKHNLDALAQAFLNYLPISIEELIGKKGKGQKSMKDVPIEKAAEYAAEDADITFQLYNILSKKLHDEPKLLELFQNIEIPTMTVLKSMEQYGVKIDPNALNEYNDLLSKQIHNLESEIYQLAGLSFNIQSPKQLAEVLFQKLNLQQGKKTSTGQLSTNEETLIQLSDRHPIIPKILLYRELAKLKSTYVEALPTLINPKTGRVHTTFAQTVAATGRLASINPNLQNIPIRTDYGKEIRKAFIPDKNHLLLSLDYSQIELRIMAALSEDPNLIQAFLNKEDIHAATAARIFDLPLDQITPDMRRQAKTANFGIIYGISAFGLAQRLNISRTQAKQLIDNYFLKYPKVQEYMQNTIHFARENGFVRTMLGRKRFIPDINSHNFTTKSLAERTAINTPIQGTAADIIKLAMIKVFDFLNQYQSKAKLILQVHDELLLEVPNDEVHSLPNQLKQIMENVFSLSVPLEVNIGIGNNWLEAH